MAKPLSPWPAEAADDYKMMVQALRDTRQSNDLLRRHGIPDRNRQLAASLVSLAIAQSETGHRAAIKILRKAPRRTGPKSKWQTNLEDILSLIMDLRWAFDELPSSIAAHRWIEAGAFCEYINNKIRRIADIVRSHPYRPPSGDIIREIEEIINNGFGK